MSESFYKWGEANVCSLTFVQSFTGLHLCPKWHKRLFITLGDGYFNDSNRDGLTAAGDEFCRPFFTRDNVVCFFNYFMCHGIAIASVLAGWWPMPPAFALLADIQGFSDELSQKRVV